MRETLIDKVAEFAGRKHLQQTDKSCMTGCLAQSYTLYSSIVRVCACMLAFFIWKPLMPSVIAVKGFYKNGSLQPSDVIGQISVPSPLYEAVKSQPCFMTLVVAVGGGCGRGRGRGGFMK